MQILNKEEKEFFAFSWCVESGFGPRKEGVWGPRTTTEQEVLKSRKQTDSPEQAVIKIAHCSSNLFFPSDR